MHAYHIFFIHSSADGHLCCFYVLVIVNSAAVNTGVHVSFQIRVFIFSGYMPWVGLLHHICNSTFNFWRNLHTILHSGCTNLHFHIFSTPSLAFIVCRLFEDGHSDWCDVIYLTIILIFISVIISVDEQNLFMCLLSMSKSILISNYMISCYHFSNFFQVTLRYSVLYLLNCVVSAPLSLVGL